MEAAARQAGAELLICTEKDLYNLGQTAGTMPLFPCAISLTISDAERLLERIEQLGRLRGEAAQ